MNHTNLTPEEKSTVADLFPDDDYFICAWCQERSNSPEEYIYHWDEYGGDDPLGRPICEYCAEACGKIIR
jgi:hypothetical protein